MDRGMRRLIDFPCGGETLLGTLDEGTSSTGLLIVSGGNEIRVGAHRGMALLAHRVAAEVGVPVFRFDRRGIGDSSGENLGYAESAPDIAAAVAAFREAAPQVTQVIGLGICDAATALARFHRAAGIHALLLANPWVAEEQDDLPPAAAIRARYAERLRDPATWLRALRGGVDFGKLFKGMVKVSKIPSQGSNPIAAAMAEGLAASNVPVTFLLARGDNTAIAFRDAWTQPVFDPVRARAAIAECATASHSFAQAADKQWLFERVRDALER